MRYATLLLILAAACSCYAEPPITRVSLTAPKDGGTVDTASLNRVIRDLYDKLEAKAASSSLSSQVASLTAQIAALTTDYALTGATPDVGGKYTCHFADTVSTTVTGFTNGSAGQKITIYATNSNTTISSTLTKTGMTIPLIAGDTLQFQHNGTSWLQVGGSVGMGRYVSLAEPDVIGDWIASNVTTYTDVDVSDDSVRKGATAVNIMFRLSEASGYVSLQFRRNGGSVGPEVLLHGGATLTYVQVPSIVVGLDGNGVFEAKFDASITNTFNETRVLGYYI